MKLFKPSRNIQKRIKMLLHNKVCDELDIKREDLARMLGIPKTTIDGWTDTKEMSQTIKFALELMLENNKKDKLINNFNKILIGFNELDSSLKEEGKKGDWQDLVERIKFILEEYKINTIEASKKMNMSSFDYLHKILNYQIAPNFDFLDKFSSTFYISNSWLLNGKGTPFSITFIESTNIKNLEREYRILREFILFVVIATIDIQK